MKLHFRTMGEGMPFFIMHGVFGSSDNWQTLGKVFAKKFKVYLIDLRNHGNSPHSSVFDYDVMAADIVELIQDEGLGQVNVLGHSMGGKVAMNLATLHPDKVNKLIVVDIAPKQYPPHHQQIFNGFHSVDLPNLTSRKEADEQLKKVISNVGVRQFILKNLTRDTEGTFSWKLNVDAIERGAEKVGQGLESEVGFSGDTLFIGGGKSDYILKEDHAMIKGLFPKSDIKYIDGAGHWVHAEKPEALSEMVLDFL
ncbi:MAG: alpha/beta fold hydrolase [Bacteroidota bacterium]